MINQKYKFKHTCTAHLRCGHLDAALQEEKTATELVHWGWAVCGWKGGVQTSGWVGGWGERRPNTGKPRPEQPSSPTNTRPEEQPQTSPHQTGWTQRWRPEEGGRGVGCRAEQSAEDGAESALRCALGGSRQAAARQPPYTCTAPLSQCYVNPLLLPQITYHVDGANDNGVEKRLQ